AGRLDAAEQTWDRTRAAYARADRELGSLTQALEGTLLFGGSRSDVRATLADVLLERARLAERARIPRLPDLLDRLALHDTEGTRLRSWSQPAQLLATSRPAARIVLERYVEDAEGRLRPQRQRELASGTALSLPPGSYRLDFEAAGYAKVHY